MMRSLYSGISGLKSHQTAMDVVGNNISNVNTTGFKSSRVTFADTLNQTLSSASAPAGNIGGINAKQIGLGSGVAAIDTIFTDGSVKSTGLNTDMCLSGNGLFVVHSESSANEMYYTRNGNFKFDASGNFVTSDGYKVQGWVADASGNITVDPSKTSDITIPAGKVMEATKTEKAVYNSNLNSGEATVTGITMMDNNGSKIVVSQNNVDTLSCGSKYNDNDRSKINNVNLEFKEGCTIFSAKGEYAMTQNYALDDDLTISCSNGDKITVPKTSPNSYKMGAAVSLLPVQKITATSDNVTLSDGATFVNNSRSQYTISLANGDVLTVAAPPGNDFTKGTDMPELEVIGIAGKEITLKDTSAGGSGATYKLTNNSGNTYKLGDKVKENVISISIDSTDTMSNAKGTVKSADSIVDNFMMRSGTIKPASGITVSSMELTDNLDSVITVSNANVRKYKVGYKYEGSIDSMALTMSDGSSTSEVSGSYTMGYSKPLSTLITVYDTLGNEHNITIYLTKTSVDSIRGNEWTASINLDGSGTATIKEKDGSISTVSMPDLRIRFSPTGECTTGVGTTELILRNGAQADQKVNVDFSNVTQFAGSNTAYGSTDGNAYGTLKSISINTTGTIIGTYTNGINREEAQVAIAQFNNAAGLTKIGSSMYTSSNNSGTPNINTVSALGCSITPSSLEMSNVDMATELTDMIVTQRGYQSNSKIITVSDELLETLINMKR